MFYLHTQTQMHIYNHMNNQHLHAHTHAHTHIQMYACRCTHAHTHTHTHTRTHTHICNLLWDNCRCEWNISNNTGETTCQCFKIIIMSHVIKHLYVSERERRHFPQIHNTGSAPVYRPRGRRYIPHNYGTYIDWVPHGQYVDPKPTEWVKTVFLLHYVVYSSFTWGRERCIADFPLLFYFCSDRVSYLSTHTVYQYKIQFVHYFGGI